MHAYRLNQGGVGKLQEDFRGISVIGGKGAHDFRFIEQGFFFEHIPHGSRKLLHFGEIIDIAAVQVVLQLLGSKLGKSL